MQFVRPLAGSVAAVATACALFAAIPASNAEWTDTKSGEISITFDVPDTPNTVANNQSDSANEKGKAGDEPPAKQEDTPKEQGGDLPSAAPENSLPTPAAPIPEEAAASDIPDEGESDAAVAP